MRRLLLSIIIVLMGTGLVFASGNPGDYIQVGDGYLGTSATRDAEDVLTDGSNLPDGAAIIAYGDANWNAGAGTGYWTQVGSDIYYTAGKVAIGTTNFAGINNKLYVYTTTATNLATGLRVVHDSVNVSTGFAGWFEARGGGVSNVGIYATALGSTYDYAAIFDSGYVGIGTISPDTALEVVGVITATGGTSTNWNTAYDERATWDGGADGLVTETGLISLGLDGVASAVTSGAYYIGVYDEFEFSDGDTVQDVLADLDFAIGTPEYFTDVRFGRARFNSTTGLTVTFALPAMDDTDYDVIITNWGQYVDVGEVSVESKATTGFVLKNSGSNTSNFFEYFAIPYTLRGDTFQKGSDTFNSTAGVSITLAPVYANTDYDVIISLPSQTLIEDIGAVSVESKAVGGFDVMNSGDDAVTTFDWIAVPYDIGGEVDYYGADTFTGGGGATTVAIGGDVGSTFYVVLITVATQVGIEDIGVVSIQSKTQTQFEVANSGAGTTAFSWRVFPQTPGAADMYRSTYDADWDNLIDQEAGGLGYDISAMDGLLKVSATVVTAITDSSTDWDTAYTHVSAATGAEHGAVVANTANMIVRRGASGEFSAGVITASLTGAVTGNVVGNVTGNVVGDVTGALTGVAAEATILETARAIGGSSFDGSAAIPILNITVADTTDTTAYVALWESATGAALLPKSDAALTYNAGTGKLTATGFIGDIVGDVTGNVTGNVSGSSTTCLGLAASATILANARTIGGVSFDGSANIVPLTIVTRDESTDATCFVGFFNDAVGTDQPNTGTNLTFNSATGILTATGFAGPLTGAVTGNVTGNVTGDLTGTAGHASDLTIASEAQGDVLYFNGSNWARLAAGISGKFLKTQGAAANPAWDTPATGNEYSAGSGIALTGSTFSVAGGTGLTQDASGLSISIGGVGTTQLANMTFSAGAPNVAYTNTNITVDADGRVKSIATGSTAGLTAGNGCDITANVITVAAGTGLTQESTGLKIDATKYTNWNTAYDERATWDGGDTGLTALTGRKSLGLTGYLTPTTSGAYYTGVYPQFTHSLARNIQDVLDDLDAAIGANEYSAGSGIALTGSTFSVAGGTGLTQDASGLSISSGGVGTTELANMTFSAGAPNVAYTNTNITVDADGRVTSIASGESGGSGGSGGWTDDGTMVRLSTVTDIVRIGLTSDDVIPPRYCGGCAAGHFPSLIVKNNKGTAAIVGWCQSSDGADGSQGAMGISGYSEGDSNATAYGGYFEARKISSLANHTHGLESAIVNTTSVVDVVPTNMAIDGGSSGVWISSGRGDVASTQASVALGVTSVGSTFRRGIVFGSGSVNVGGKFVAILMANNQRVCWGDDDNFIVGSNVTDRITFYINGAPVGYVDATGFH